MSFLVEAIDRARTLSEKGFPKSPSTQPEVQRQFQKFDESVSAAEATQELVPFLREVSEQGISRLRRDKLNRVLRGAWHDQAFDELGIEAVLRAEADIRRSSDQALIEGYLTYFPYDRPCMAPLATAASQAADRRLWAWQKRSARWSLFIPEKGPRAVANAITSADCDPETVLIEAGLGRSIAATRFGRSSFVAACKNLKGLAGARAVDPQMRLLELFDSQAQASDLHVLVQALLEPWISEKPEAEHRKAISEFLLHQVGDPRIVAPRWKSILRDIAESEGMARAEAIVHVFKRWLTEVAMREFFRAIAKTTDRPDQWDQRSKFWLAYLDAGLVTDAWPALGERARRRIGEIIRQGGEKADFGIMRGGPASSSSIIMQIGDLRISEWSDNGSCRFWSDDDRAAPGLYKKFYDGAALRTTHGRRDFEYEPHVPPSPGWEGKFAGIIHRRTNIAHPKLGRGRGRFWGETW